MTDRRSAASGEIVGKPLRFQPFRRLESALTLSWAKTKVPAPSGHGAEV